MYQRENNWERGLCLLVMSLSFSTLGFVMAAHGGASDSAKIVGPNACAECHKQEAEAWKGTHHFKTFRDLPRSKRADDIAKKMGIRRVKSESLCLTCHFTLKKKDDKEEAIAGISCESCHNSGQDWIKLHSGFSGKSAQTETKSEAETRLKASDAKGMIRPSSIYQLAKNCYSCHVVPREDLVNTGGHHAGSPFELVSWSQGEVRHTTWHSKGKENAAASPERRRLLFLVGLGVELETALRAVGKATVRKPYAFEMAARANKARDQLQAAANVLPGVPEIAKIVDLSHSVGLKLNNDAALSSAADAISQQISTFAAKTDGTALSAIDALIPGPATYRGKARLPDTPQ